MKDSNQEPREDIVGDDEDRGQVSLLNDDIAPLSLVEGEAIWGRLEKEGAPIEVTDEDGDEIWMLRNFDPSPDYATLRRRVKTWILRNEEGWLCRLRGNIYFDYILTGAEGRFVLVHDRGKIDNMQDGLPCQPWQVFLRRPYTKSKLNAMISPGVSGPLAWEQVIARGPAIGTWIARGVVNAQSVGAHLADQDSVIRYAANEDVLAIGMRNPVSSPSDAPYRPDGQDNLLEIIARTLASGRPVTDPCVSIAVNRRHWILEQAEASG